MAKFSSKILKKFKKGQDDEEEDLSVLDDYSEPWTFRRFWEEQVTGRYKVIKNFLKEHGILYFLFSPFQYKNRLTLKIVLVVIGIFAGVIPRTISMVHQAQERNASSEIAISQGMVNGDITVTPVSSGYHDKQHVIAFTIDGDTADGVPSTTDGFRVNLIGLRNVADASDVHYRYKVVPVSSTRRLLLLYVDNRYQDDNAGVYGVDVAVKGTSSMQTPIQVSLSNKQSGTKLWSGKKIDLSSMSSALTTQKTDSSDTTKAIAKAKKALNSKLNIYKINEQRLNAQGMTLDMTYQKVRQWAIQNLQLTSITDSTTTDELPSSVPDQSTPEVPSLTLTFNGKSYTSQNGTTTASDTGSTNNQSSTSNGTASLNQSGTTNGQATSNPAQDTELPQAAQELNDIQSALQTLNAARFTKYNTLMTVSHVLNQKIDPTTMGDQKTMNENKS